MESAGDIPHPADHTVPRSFGGAGAPGNLRVLCAERNVRKATAARFRS